MIDRPATSSTALCALALCCCVAAGCAGVKHKQAEEAVAGRLRLQSRRLHRSRLSRAHRRP